MPDLPGQSPVPAILEYLPYRKRDGTAQRDESTYPIFAANGYAGIRVDIAGTGESDGTFDDEYSARELNDGVEVIAWIARQAWCNGNVGMMGISWGGFNSLQIAAMNPPALRAVIAIGTTVDRYNDDIHYKNGCLLYSNAGWASVMLCFASRPPDPLLVGERWREMWLERLQTQPFPLETWLAHQHRDEYWRRGSVCEDYNAMDIPALVISGWADGYINAPPAALENFTGVTKAINGPWIHKYPHLAFPHPRIDFHTEALNWWDAWLNGVDNGVEFVGHHWNPFGTVDDQRPPLSQRHKGQVHLPGHGIDRRVDVVYLEQRAHLVTVAEHHVHPIGQQATPLVAVPVHAEPVRKAERYRSVGGMGHVHGVADRRFGLLGIPQVTLAVQVRGRSHQVGVDIVRREVRGNAQVRVHGSVSYTHLTLPTKA